MKRPRELLGVGVWRRLWTSASILSVLIAALAFTAICADADGASVDAFTPDPSHWRPLHYFDLQLPAGEAEHYASLWADRLAANDAAYAAKGDKRFAVGHAPATEAHFSINFQTKFVVLSVLDEASDCQEMQRFPDAYAILKRCPLRLAVWKADKLEIVESTGCFLERLAVKATLDPEAAAAYASYDIATKSIRVGVTIRHHAVPECTLTLPLHAPSR